MHEFINEFIELTKDELIAVAIVTFLYHCKKQLSNIIAYIKSIRILIFFFLYVKIYGKRPTIIIYFKNWYDKYILRVPESLAIDGIHAIRKNNRNRVKNVVKTLQKLILMYLEIEYSPIHKCQGESYAIHAWTQLQGVVKMMAASETLDVRLCNDTITALNNLVPKFLQLNDSQTVKKITDSVTSLSISYKITDSLYDIPTTGMQKSSNQIIQTFQSQSDKYKVVNVLENTVKQAFEIADNDINIPLDDKYFEGKDRVILAYFDESLPNKLKKMFSKDRLNRLENNQVQTELWLLGQCVKFIEPKMEKLFQRAMEVNHPFIKKLLLWNFGIAQLLDDLSQSPHCTEQQAKEFLTQSQSLLCIPIEAINSLDHLDDRVANDIIDILFASRYMHSMKDVIIDKLLLCTFKCGGKVNNGQVLARGINRCIIIAIENDTVLDEKPAADKLKEMLKCHLIKLPKYELNEDVLYNVIKHLEVEQLNLEGKRYLKESNHRDYTRLLHKIVDIIKRFKS